MRPGLIIIGILMFAFVTAVLVVWGMRKAYFQRETLTKMLFSKASAKVMDHLKTHETVSEVQIKKLTEGIKASEFHSRSQAVVSSDMAFTKKLIQIMLDEGLIEKYGKAVYKKKK